MPKILINEVDRTSAGTPGSYNNISVLITGYAYRTAYEDPHPEKTLAAIRYVPVEGKADITVSLIGASRRIERDMTASVAPCADTAHSDGVAGVQE